MLLLYGFLLPLHSCGSPIDMQCFDNCFTAVSNQVTNETTLGRVIGRNDTGTDRHTVHNKKLEYVNTKATAEH
jgi:hypothetical protein